MKKRITLLFLGAFLGIILFYIWKSDSFQKQFFPKNFWQNRVKILEETVEFTKNLVDGFRIEYYKEAYFSEVEISQNANFYKLQGMNIEEAKRYARENKKKELDEMKELLNQEEKLLKEIKAEYEQAKSELKKIDD